VAGRVVPTEIVALIEEVLGDWKAPATPLPTLNLPAVIPNPQQRITVQDTQQSIVMLGYLTPAVNPQALDLTDYTALKLLNTYLGNGLSSRLFVELREKRGLAYEVSAFYPTRLDTSQFVVYMGTAPENTAIALAGLHTEVERLRSTPLTPEELESAQNKILGQYALGKQTNSQLAQIFGWYEILGLGVEFDIRFQQEVSKVTIASAQAAADRYFIQPYVSLLGPAEAVNPLTDAAASA
jgi:zinc protease